MHVCFFGDYDPDYARNRVVLRALEEEGVVVAHVRAKHGVMGILRALRALYACQKNVDVTYVGYSDALLLPLLATLISSTPVIWDMFYSRYEALVYDRKLASRWGIKGLYYYALEWILVRYVDRVLLDTQAHVAYVQELFGGDEEQYAYIPVGTDDSVFYPRENGRQKSAEVVVGFYGKYIPLQGVAYIIEAAKRLEGKAIRFRLLGSGQTYDAVKQKAEELSVPNVSFESRVPYEELPEFIASCDIMLGVFGDTQKAQRVIPNKVYEAMAMGAAIITGDTPASRELLTDGKDAMLTPCADAQALAEGIEALCADSMLREQIGLGARETYCRHATPKHIGEKLSMILHVLV